ncbi:MAG: hypothetical protein ACK5MD_10565 [Flavobacteriales bacterium]
MKILNNIYFKEKFAVIVTIFGFLIAIVVPIICIVLYNMKLSEELEKQSERIYLLTNNKVLEAVISKDSKTSVEASAKGHIMLFHEWFWSLEPYEEYIQEAHKKALNLVDNTGKLLQNQLKSKNYFSQLISSKYSYRIEMNPKDITIDFSQEPYVFTCKAKLRILRNNDVLYRNLITTGSLTHTGKSVNNFTDWMIRNYKVLNFDPI